MKEHELVLFARSAVPISLLEEYFIKIMHVYIILYEPIYVCIFNMSYIRRQITQRNLGCG